MNAETAEKLLDLASRVIFTFGTLAFSILALSYWRQWLGRRKEAAPRSSKSSVFPAFTLACAAAFLLNLAFQAPNLGWLNSNWALPLIVARNLAAGLLAPLLLHLVFELEAPFLPGRRAWRSAIATVYVAAILLALAKGLSDTGIVALSALDLARRAPGILLCVSAALGLAVQAVSRRRPQKAARTHRNWIRALLALMAASAAISFLQPLAFVNLLPDYLLLAFFCASLYYRERLVFFDLLVKRGLFFGVGLAVLTMCFAFGSRVLFRSDWNPAILALLLLPFWLAGPWIFQRVDRAVDRLWLRRRYSAPDAEREFQQRVQICSAEPDLRSCAAAALGEIFQAPVRVEFGDIPAPGTDAEALAAAICAGASRLGHIVVLPRPDGVPYLSDDRRCLQSIARELGVTLENLRFRRERIRQQEREQELRWLASRAELKALRAQINPHFLFNALNSIAGLIGEQPQFADDTIERLGRVFRYTLRKSENEWVPLREEVEFIAAYLQVEQARFGDRLQLSLQVDPAAAHISIPAMSIQPLVENAVKHGVSAVEGRGLVSLAAHIDEDRLTVEVRDNGPGFPRGFSLDTVSNGDGAHGLRNVAERLRGYYGGAARLEWSCGPAGTCVWLSIPRLAAGMA